MEQAQQQAEHFELLLEVGILLSSKLELSELLTSVMQLSARVVNAETASLLLVDPKTNELYFDVALGLDPALTKLRLKMGQGIAGSVAQSAAPMIINDVRKDPRWNSKMDKDSGFVTRSILAAPIILKGKCIGVVEAINHIGGDFSFTDLRIFEAFASQTGVAIENARLFAAERERTQTLDSLLNEIRDAAFLTDGAGAVLVANAAARAYLGGGAGAVPLAEALAGLTLTPPLEDILRSEKGLVAFEAAREKPQKLLLAGTASLIRDPKDGAVKGRVVVFRDVTAERREEGLKRNFLSLISHKLKTPLSSITGYSQLLFDDFKAKPEAAFQATALKTVLTQGQKLTALVDKLLNFTVLEQLDAQAIDRKPVDLEATLKAAVEGLEPLLAERAARVTLEVPPGLKAAGDAGLLREVFKNLIENGVKFCAAAPPAVTVTARRAGAAVELGFRDNGPGIPPEERAKVFERFYQIDAAFTGQVEGWGLGLPFVKKVVETLGGAVRLEPGPGPGSVFVVTLPAADA